MAKQRPRQANADPNSKSQPLNGQKKGPEKENTTQATAHQPKPKLSRGSCTPCRTNKLKCNKKKPHCDKCMEAGVECSYPLEMKRGTVTEALVSEEPRQSRQPASAKKTTKAKESTSPKKSATPAPEKSVEPQQFPTPGISEPSEDQDQVADTQRLSPMEENSSATVRRSCRARKPAPVKLPDGTQDDDELVLSPTFPKPVKAATNEPRRNLKRKAAPESFEVPDNLLDEALAPIQPGELEDWDSWVEIESDPDLFNLILQDLGVEGVKVQELFGGVEEGLAFVPKPVHGLIFLYEYIEEEAQEETENGDEVWFANQTTDNACATLALFNIIMNAEDIELGDRLNAFYETSADLSPPFKGHFLSNATWIRTVHNQFARRLDLLNADLVLSNQVDLLAKQKQLEKKKKQSSRLHVAKRQKKTKKPISDAAYHFIAYVPVDGKVYQLDGLEKAAVCVGTISEGEDWTNVATPTIEARIAQYSGQLQFSLLALCRSPLESLRVDIATNQIAWTIVRHELYKQLKEKGIGEPDNLDPRSEEGFRLSEEDEEQYGILPSHKQHPDRRKLEALAEWLICYSKYPEVRRRSEDELRARIEDISAEQSRLRAEFKTEQTTHAQDVRRAQERKKDYTPVIHRWVQMLAEKGVLGDIAAET